jgi:hypothetical protein
MLLTLQIFGNKSKFPFVKTSICKLHTHSTTSGMDFSKETEVKTQAYICMRFFSDLDNSNRRKPELKF